MSGVPNKPLVFDPQDPDTIYAIDSATRNDSPQALPWVPLIGTLAEAPEEWLDGEWGAGLAYVPVAGGPAGGEHREIVEGPHAKRSALLGDRWRVHRRHCPWFVRSTRSSCARIASAQVQDIPFTQ